MAETAMLLDGRMRLLVMMIVLAVGVGCGGSSREGEGPGGAGGAGAGGAKAGGAKAGGRPNVVLIISDDQGWMDFGFMGSSGISTPNLDRLAERGAVFPNSYVPTALCRPSLASLMTGLYPSQHGICSNDFPTATDRAQTHGLITSVATFPRLLADAGYACLQTGKFWEGHFSNGGFTEGMTEKGRHGDEGLAIGRKTMQPVYDFIDRNVAGERPFFVWYAPMLPHTPHNPPKRLLEKYAAKTNSPHVAAYWAMCEWMDETCGELVGFLDQRGLRENTMIVFIVDNGWIQQPAAKGKFDVRSKRSPYEGGVRTPVVISQPGRTRAGRYEDLVSSIDLAPTILDACGVRAPGTMPGLSLLDRAGGGATLARDAVFGEIFLHDAVVVDDPQRSLTHRWIRRGDWKLIRPTSAEAQPELYNLESDPHEKQNLATEQLRLVEQLNGRIERWTSTLARP